MADEQQAVLEAFQALIKDADLDSMSEKAIRKQLAEDLAIDITPYKELIAEEIKKLLHSLTPAEKKRKAEEEHAQEGRKVARVTNDTPGEVDLGGRKKVVVRAFKGKTLVDIREYYEDKTSGEMKPGKKGIALSPSDFAVLAGNVDAITSALEEGDEDFSHQLSEKVKVGIFKGKFVDIREWYDKDGEKAPGAKGCALTKEQWETLCDSIDVIKEDIKALPTSSAPGKSAPVKPASGKKPTAASGETADDGDEGQLPIILSTNRRADISVFKGRTFVNIREYYEKDGAMLPGKKGISLTPDQFQQLQGEASSVSAALKDSDAGFELDLSDKRKVKIFRGMVDIREYYEKEGEQRPGPKGISLPLAQWEKLSSNFNLLTESLESET